MSNEPKDKIEYTDYQVAFDVTNSHVEIILKDHKPSPGHKVVGEFSVNAVEGKIKGEDDFDTHGDHVFIALAKDKLTELGVTDFSQMVFEDKASNAPTGNTYILSHEEREQAIRDSVDPHEKRVEISENIDEAAAKFETKPEPKKAQTKGKAKPKTE